MMDPPKMCVGDEVFVQYVFDNTDHNAKTLDGNRTFHCLGRLAAFTPESGVTIEGSSKKCKKMPSAAQLASCCNVETVPYRGKQNTGLKTITFDDVSTLLRNDSTQLPTHYLLYLSGKSIFEKELPSWRGFMEVLSLYLPQDNVSRIVCLPFINEPPSKYTSINTAIVHAMAECKQLKQKTCIVTFDQPLFIKATEIVAGNDEMKNVVVRLSGFHMLMSFLGSIGNIMDGSGLEDIWGTVYASESVKNMMTGKSFSRAIRAHMLTYTSIGKYFYKYMADELSLFDRNKYETFVRLQLTHWNENPPSYNFCQNDITLKEMTEVFLYKLNSLKSNGPTAKLFIQYFEMVTIALQFIEAELLGNWQLHLQSVKKMLPYFHASGYFLYAKSAQIYLQSMIKLEMEMDDEEYRLFTQEGYFTIRRSYKAWSGIWSDMTIEQTLNRFFGTDLIHGSVTPSVVARYLSCMPTSFAVMDSLETYSELHSNTSEQHVDLSISRLTKDNKDLQAMTSWLEKHKPFELRDYLTSLSTGIIGRDDIN
ncbi:uncharacterized protein [Leptinotarsa decemlineata]|uniref:uncharacterized protein n=1 Tax=Leptinotarsa decemlineata TaxID=7539 RepID=UPI003D3051C2